MNQIVPIAILTIAGLGFAFVFFFSFVSGLARNRRDYDVLHLDPLDGEEWAVAEPTPDKKNVRQCE